MWIANEVGGNPIANLVTQILQRDFCSPRGKPPISRINLVFLHLENKNITVGIEHASVRPAFVELVAKLFVKPTTQKTT